MTSLIFTFSGMFIILMIGVFTIILMATSHRGKVTVDEGGMLCFSMAIVLLAATMLILGLEAVHQQGELKAALKECEAKLPRNQTCIIEYQVVPTPLPKTGE